MHSSPRLVLALALFVLLSACHIAPVKPKEPPAPPTPIIGEPVATHQFTIKPDDDVVGTVQVTHSSAEDTLSDIARRFNLGYEELVRANPNVDPWLPGEGREILLPTQFVLPDAPREGLVINLPTLRVFYYPKHAAGEPQTVITHPIGIGKVGWSTPVGVTKVASKKKDPVWTPPASVRKEHKENGEILPARVPAGPDNPLGAYAMTLGWPSYLIHGTNKPYGVGMRSSHGCMRFYPEDIALLFDEIPLGTQVRVVNQPFLYGWHENSLYVQVVPTLEPDEPEKPAKKDHKAANAKAENTSALLNAAISNRMWDKVKQHGATLDLEEITSLLANPTGISVPVSQQDLTYEKFLAAVPRVRNRIPEGATWDGREELLVTAEEFEAVRAGKPLPVRKVGANTAAR
jgi:L,D-transpeptidase ErfK/SrfK